MKTFMIILILFMTLFPGRVLTQYKYWEELSVEDRNLILEDTSIDESVKKYYLVEFKASDDSLTFALLDTLTRERIFNPLYFSMFNKILMSSDGALAEVMDEYCAKMIYSFPKESITYFNQNNIDTLMHTYSLFMGTFMTLREYEKLKVYLNESLFASSNDVHEKLKVFLREIEVYVSWNKQ